jgi:hypothetical protein
VHTSILLIATPYKKGSFNVILFLSPCLGALHDPSLVLLYLGFCLSAPFLLLPLLPSIFGFLLSLCNPVPWPHQCSYSSLTSAFLPQHSPNPNLVLLFLLLFSLVFSFDFSFMSSFLVPAAFLLVPVGSCWFLLVSVGSCWFLLVPAGFCWFLLVHAASSGSCKFLLFTTKID